MERNQEIVTMLKLMPQPAFLVQDGIIRHTNAAAGIYLLQENTPLSTIMEHGTEDYTAFNDGSLYLSLRLGHLRLGASVIHIGSWDLFTLEQPSEQDQLRVLALAAQQLRGPMTSLMLSTDAWMQQDNAQTAAASRSIHQLLRIISNMSDAQQYAQPGSDRREYCDFVSILGEILEKSNAYLQESGIPMQWELPSTPVYTMLDRDKLERAVLNMLANAIKFASGPKTVSVRLKVTGDRLHLSVNGESTITNANVYCNFQRQPSLEDPRHGLGLGMVLIRSFALSHGGCVLTDQPTPNASRITLTLPICKTFDGQVRSPLMQIDYACQQDRCLLELSEVLPIAAYRTENR